MHRLPSIFYVMAIETIYKEYGFLTPVWKFKFNVAAFALERRGVGVGSSFWVNHRHSHHIQGFDSP